MTSTPAAKTPPPRPLRSALVSVLFNLVVLSLLVGASIGIAALARATGLPWLPYVVVIVGFSVLMGAFRYSTERSRARRLKREEKGAGQ